MDDGSRTYWTNSANTPTAPYPGHRKLTISTRLRAELARDAGNVTWGFFPFDKALAANGRTTPAGAGIIETHILNGTNMNNGFTAIVWAEQEANPNSLGFVNLTHVDSGDLMFVQQQANPDTYVEYWWNGSEWRLDTQSATSAVPAGANIWLKRYTGCDGRVFVITH